jgi:hypothetical protein
MSRIASRAKADGASLRHSIEGLQAAGTAKFRTAKALLALSEEEPRRLAPFFDDFRRLLVAENNIIRWTAIRIVANLVAAGSAERAEEILSEYLRPISGPTMITAATTIAGAARGRGVAAFVARQTRNPRPATRKKAEALQRRLLRGR